MLSVNFLLPVGTEKPTQKAKPVGCGYPKPGELSIKWANIWDRIIKNPTTNRLEPNVLA